MADLKSSAREVAADAACQIGGSVAPAVLVLPGLTAVAKSVDPLAGDAAAVAAWKSLLVVGMAGPSPDWVRGAAVAQQLAQAVLVLQDLTVVVALVDLLAVVQLEGVAGQTQIASQELDPGKIVEDRPSDVRLVDLRTAVACPAVDREGIVPAEALEASAGRWQEQAAAEWKT